MTDQINVESSTQIIKVSQPSGIVAITKAGPQGPPGPGYGGGTLDVTGDLSATGAFDVGGAATFAGDVTIAGRIDADAFQNEGLSFSPQNFYCTRTYDPDIGPGGYVFPNNQDSFARVGGRGLPVHWLDNGLTIGFDCIKNATEDGNIVWKVVLKKWNSYGNAATPVIELDSTELIAAPDDNLGMMTVTHANWTDIDAPPDLFGSLYRVEVHRIGTSVFDQINDAGGSVVLTEIAIIRGEIGL